MEAMEVEAMSKLVVAAVKEVNKLVGRVIVEAESKLDGGGIERSQDKDLEALLP